jgi:hypothetical protein
MKIVETDLTSSISTRRRAISVIRPSRHRGHEIGRRTPDESDLRR